MSRESILSAVKANQPEASMLLEVPQFTPWFDDAILKFIDVARGIGAEVFLVENHEQIVSIIKGNFADAQRIITPIEALANITDNTVATIPHDYENTDLFIMPVTLGVAENGAVWITGEEIKERVLPFITQHLAVVINKENIVPTMHEAYDVIGSAEYGFATFIAGPSKTADIEQSLVLGAHGPRTMTIFVM